MIQLNNNHRNHEFIVEIISRMFYKDTLRSIQQPEHNSLCGTDILDSASVSFPVTVAWVGVLIAMVFEIVDVNFNVFSAITCPFCFGLW